MNLDYDESLVGEFHAKQIQAAMVSSGHALSPGSGCVDSDPWVAKTLDGGRDTATVIRFNPSEIKRLLGIVLPLERIRAILHALDFTTMLDGDGLVVTVPDHRLDVAIPADIVEEVAVEGRRELHERLGRELVEPVLRDAIDVERRRRALDEEARRPVLDERDRSSTDARDAAQLLELLLSGRFPRLWRPTPLPMSRGRRPHLRTPPARSQK